MPYSISSKQYKYVYHVYNKNCNFKGEPLLNLRKCISHQKSAAFIDSCENVYLSWNIFRYLLPSSEIINLVPSAIFPSGDNGTAKGSCRHCLFLWIKKNWRILVLLQHNGLWLEFLAKTLLLFHDFKVRQILMKIPQIERTSKSYQENGMLCDVSINISQITSNKTL